MKKLHIYFHRILALLILGVFAFPVLAVEQMAEVGVYDNDGRIKLHIDRFQTAFPNDTPVSELRLEISNGFFNLLRKGYGEDEACRTEMIEVLDKNGSPIKATATKLAGTPVFIFSTSVIDIFACLDDKCHALKYATLGPPLLSASCDRTELSNEKCQCHINDGTGVRLTEGDFCNSVIDSILKPTIYWVRLKYIKNL